MTVSANTQTPLSPKERKAVLLRLDPAVHAALSKWAADDLRSINAQIEMALRDALRRAGRLPEDAMPIRKPGRPAKDSSAKAG